MGTKALLLPIIPILAALALLAPAALILTRGLSPPGTTRAAHPHLEGPFHTFQQACGEAESWESQGIRAEVFESNCAWWVQVSRF
jgi:hypothetical protein